MLFHEMPYDCLEKILQFVPLKDQLNCVEVWPEWRGNLLLYHRQLKISRNDLVKGIDELSEEFVFGEKGFGFLKILNNWCNVQELDVAHVSDKYLQQIIDDIGREKRKFRIINMGWGHSVALDFEAYKRMVDAVPELEELRSNFGGFPSADDCLRYLLTTATELHTLDLLCSPTLTADAFKGAGVRFKILRARGCIKVKAYVLVPLLASSRDTLEELSLCKIPYSCIHTLVTFKNLKVLSYMYDESECLMPADAATAVSLLSELQHLRKLHIYGCIHDEDLRVMSRNFKDIKYLHLWPRSHPLSYDALMSLRYMTSLETLQLHNMQNLTDDHLEVISKELTLLEDVKLENLSNTGRGIKFLINLPNLNKIWCQHFKNIFASDEEREEVIRDWSAAQTQKGLKCEKVISRPKTLYLGVCDDALVL